MEKTLRIATRQSPLALWQANYVKQQLLFYYPQLKVELIPIVTKGDILLDTPLAKIGGKGLFVKQLEEALLNQQADIAVHSIKDVPAQFPAGLQLTTICEREDPRDAFVSNRYHSFAELPAGAIVGTSSLRRQCQIRARYPHLQIRDLRGNVGTRLNKLDQGEYDAIVLASAGLKRLGLNQRITSLLAIDELLPAVGQGAVGIESRIDDVATNTLLAKLNHQPTAICVQAERAMNQRLQGGCQVPIGCLAQLNDQQLQLQALVGSLDGQTILRSQIHGPCEAAEALGVMLAEQLLAQGADKILAEIYADA